MLRDLELIEARRKAIKRELRALAAAPGQPGARATMQRLTGELARLKTEADITALAPKRQATRPALVPDPAETDPDADAIATWPRELRTRLRDSAFSAVIDGGRGRV